ncbi:glycosyltransferase [Parabacteroides faecis]|uniref:glycosyltransferase n=1 Tax=Parabacteroides faecis TaxID=1217282 RepID=UPI0021647942|nr:glycosyltransferase [Parabacteroides faecis]MCS2893472.1 glycosyltransferase [Parabacteroides faecis]UVQ49347.1 glycosyltransferase [Parabacteroides faecis]
MKIVQINAIYGGGSTGRICEELTEWLNANGHTCTTLYALGSGAKLNSVSVSSRNEVRLNGLLARIFGLDASFSYVSTNRIIKYLKEEKPDVVHLHNIHSNYVNIKRLLDYLGKYNIATVITLHDCWYFTGKCTHYTETGCYKWKESCGGCPRLRQDIPSFFFDRTSHMLNEKRIGFGAIKKLGVIGVSDWITNQARQSILKKAKCIQRIYNWVDTDIFKLRDCSELRLKYSSLKDKTKILCISNDWNSTSIRFKDLLSFSSCLPKYFQILLVGKCDTMTELPSNITYIGYVNGTDKLAELYSFADIYVHLSHEDTFGKVIAEAMACGTPAIVYNATALPELVAEGRGYVVETGNVQAIVECLIKYRNIGKEKHSAKGIEFIVGNCEKKMLLEQTFMLYSNIIN